MTAGSQTISMHLPSEPVSPVLGFQRPGLGPDSPAAWTRAICSSGSGRMRGKLGRSSSWWGRGRGVLGNNLRTRPSNTESVPHQPTCIASRAAAITWNRTSSCGSACRRQSRPRSLASAESAKPPSRIAIRGEAGPRQRMGARSRRLPRMVAPLGCSCSKALPPET